MSYTLRQVQPLLNATELLLFSQSRRDRIGALTPRELRTKITRTRTLRDKFRDLYQRQTVAAQRSTRTPRQLTGSENERTQKKAEIFAEILERFEAQLPKAETKLAKNVPSPKAQTGRTSRRSTGNTPAKGNADIAMRGATTRKKSDVQRAQQKAGAAGEKALAAGKKKTSSSKKAAQKTEKSAVTTTAKQKAADKKTSARNTTASSKKKAPAAITKGKAPSKSGKSARVSAAPSAAARGAVPIAQTARAKRVNTLKEAPVNQKVHASARARNARHQAKKDSR